MLEAAFIVLRKSVEVIFPCRQVPVTPYTQVRFRFFDLNCCHLHFFDVKLAILFVIEIVVYQLWLNIDVETGK